MHFAIVTLFPELCEPVSQHGVVGQAHGRGEWALSLHNPRSHATDRHRTVDASPYGGGAGMVLQFGPTRAAIDAAKAASGADKAWLLDPAGRRFDQALAEEMAAAASVVLVAGRYEGVDARIGQSEDVDTLSLGDFVLSGGECAAVTVVDAVVRLLPGVLGDPRSTQDESFSQALLEYPHYTRPEAAAGAGIPAELLSGNHAAIDRWRRQQALLRTWHHRPDLLERVELDADDVELLLYGLGTGNAAVD